MKYICPECYLAGDRAPSLQITENITYAIEKVSDIDCYDQKHSLGLYAEIQLLRRFYS